MPIAKNVDLGPEIDAHVHLKIKIEAFSSYF